MNENDSLFGAGVNDGSADSSGRASTDGDTSNSLAGVPSNSLFVIVTEDGVVDNIRVGVSDGVGVNDGVGDNEGVGDNDGVGDGTMRSVAISETLGTPPNLCIRSASELASALLR